MRSPSNFLVKRAVFRMEPPNAIHVATEAAKALGIIRLAPKIYEDVLQPVARQVGQNLVVVAKAVEVALAPISGGAWGYDQIKEYLKLKVAARLAQKLPGEIKPPNPVIAWPVIMGMAFAADEPALREMYANLLAAAMHAPSAGEAHPAFAEIIRQLSPPEARILQMIAAKYHIGETIFSESNTGSAASDEKLIAERWRDLFSTCGVTDIRLADVFYHNLIRLGIFKEPLQVWSDLFKGADPVATRRSIEITDFGDLFLNVCVRG